MATATTTFATATTTTSATTTCVSVAPGKDGYLPPGACGNLLPYRASFAAAVLFVVLFGITTLVHAVQGFAYKKKFAWVVTMGGAWEIAAMVMRALLAKKQNSEIYDTLHTILFLLAPLWINAFLYMTLGRMVWFFDERKRLAGLSAQRFGSLFVWLDILSFIVQATGAVIASQTAVADKTIMLGLHIYMAGIGVQEFFILCFTLMLITLHRRMLIQEKRSILLDRLNNGKLPWRWLFYGMYFSLVMITVRIIFRICQYSRGTDAGNPMLTHEAYEYVLDALPMFICLAVLNFTHPGRIITGPDASWPRLSRKEKKELKRQRKADKAARKKGLYYPDTNTNSDEDLSHGGGAALTSRDRTPLNTLRYQEEGGEYHHQHQENQYPAPVPAAVDHQGGSDRYDDIQPTTAYYPVSTQDYQAPSSRWQGYASYDHSRG